MKRGEIYYIKRRDTVGAEVMKARPGVIISNNALNATSEAVEVVYLTTQPKKDLPTHVHINATGVSSTALCEQIDTVSVSLVDNWCGICSAEEMAAIDKALLQSLSLSVDTSAQSAIEEALRADVARLQEERDRYGRMIDSLLSGAVTVI